jgi:KRAB domain-containing zinc finger protein
MKEQNDLMQKSNKHYCYDCKSEFSTKSTLDEHISEIHSLNHKLQPGPKPQSTLETAQPINYFEMNVKGDDSDKIDKMESIEVEEAIEIKDDPVAVGEAIEIKDEPVDEESKDLDILGSKSGTRSLNLEFEAEGVSSGNHKPENEKSHVSPINNTIIRWKKKNSFKGMEKFKKSSTCPNCHQVFKHKQDMEIHFLNSCKFKMPPKQKDAEPEFVDCQEPNIVVKEEILDNLHSEVQINEGSESESGENFDSFEIGLQVPGIKIVTSEKIHMSDEQWQDSCVSCGKKFKYTNCLFKHKCGPVKKFPCPDCNKSFSQKSRLDSHIANRNTRNNGCIQNFDQPRQIGPIHISPKIFQCPDCNKHFSQNSRLQRHLETRNDCLSTNQNQAELIVGSGASHLCVLCNKTFTLRRNLDRHKLLVHETDQSKITMFTCPRCQKSFTLKQTLTRHVDRGGCKYLDPKKNPLCSVCNIVFVNKKALIKHVQKVHENPMPKPQMPFKDLPAVHQSTMLNVTGTAPGNLRYILPKPPTNPMGKSQNDFRKKIAMIPSTQTPIVQTLTPVQFIDPNLTPQKIPMFPIPRPAPVIEPSEPKPRLESTHGKMLLNKLKQTTSKKTINALKKYGIYKSSD